MSQQDNTHTGLLYHPLPASEPSSERSSAPSARHRPVPLRGVKVNVEARGASALVTVQQRYVNDQDEAIEATYLFPLEDQAAVVGFKVYTRELSLIGEVFEREEAFERYDDALTEGHGAYLLDQERPNAFTARVGKLKPKQEAIIEVSYLTTLSFESAAEAGARDKVRLMIPTVVAPRYVSHRELQEPAVGEPLQELWQQPRHLNVPYGLELSVRFCGVAQGFSVASPSHPISLSTLPSQGAQGSEVIVTLSREREALDHDFILLYDALPSPDLLSEEGSIEAGRGFAVLERGTRDPEASYLACTFKAPLSEGSEAPKPIELYAVLDCSGSMSGQPIQQAKRALGLLFRGLEEGDRFNLICFGSQFVRMWPEAKLYTQESLDEAMSYLEGVDADLGGTELLTPLTSLFKQLKKEERVAQVVLLTDGQVSDEEAIYAQCKTNAQRVRLFTFGIGDAVSESLVRGCARLTGGRVEFIHDGERIEPKVLRVNKSLRRPSVHLDELSINGAQLELTRPHQLFEGELTTIYARHTPHLTQPADSLQPHTLTLRSSEHTWQLPLVELTSQAHSEGEPPTQSVTEALWAREMTRELEQKTSSYARGDDEHLKALLKHALLHQQTSSHTSFVAIEHREEAERELSEVTPRKVPLMMPRDQRGALMNQIFNPFAQLFSSAPSGPCWGGFNMRSSSDWGIFPRSKSSYRYAQASSPASPKLQAPLPSLTELLLQLLNTQRASGAFAWSRALKRSLKRHTGDVNNAELKTQEQRVLTHLTLRLFTELFASERDVWERAADKAERFLTQQPALTPDEQAWLERQLSA